MIIEILGACVLALLTALPIGLVAGYRRLRNLDRLENALRHQRVAMHLVSVSQQTLKASQEQLAACRALLAVTMRERDHYQRALDHLAKKVVVMERQRRQERIASRYWLTRTIMQRKVSEN